MARRRRDLERTRRFDRFAYRYMERQGLKPAHMTGTSKHFKVFSAPKKLKAKSYSVRTMRTRQKKFTQAGYRDFDRGLFSNVRAWKVRAALRQRRLLQDPPSPKARRLLCLGSALADGRDRLQRMRDRLKSGFGNYMRRRRYSDIRREAERNAKCR